MHTILTLVFVSSSKIIIAVFSCAVSIPFSSQVEERVKLETCKNQSVGLSVSQEEKELWERENEVVLVGGHSVFCYLTTMRNKDHKLRH